jgi:hypothetical protein
MTKAETKIIEYVRKANACGTFAGLRTSPTDSSYRSHEFRFLRRLHENGLIVWVETKKRGSGWSLPDTTPPR